MAGTGAAAVVTDGGAGDCLTRKDSGSDFVIDIGEPEEEEELETEEDGLLLCVPSAEEKVKDGEDDYKTKEDGREEEAFKKDLAELAEWAESGRADLASASAQQLKRPIEEEEKVGAKEEEDDFLPPIPQKCETLSTCSVAATFGTNEDIDDDDDCCSRSVVSSAGSFVLTDDGRPIPAPAAVAEAAEGASAADAPVKLVCPVCQVHTTQYSTFSSTSYRNCCFYISF